MSDLRTDPELVTVEDLRRQLRLPPMAASSDEDADLQMKLYAATGLVLNYIARPTDEAWTAEVAAWTIDSVPRVVQQAILVQATELFRFRGDDADSTPTPNHGFLSPLVTALLHHYRDMTLA